MNVHMNAHFPVVPVACAAIGAVVLAVTGKQPWGGVFAALFAAS